MISGELNYVRDTAMNKNNWRHSVACLCLLVKCMSFGEAHFKSSLKSFISKEESAACPVYSIVPIMSAALSLCSLFVSSHAAW